MLDLIHEYVFSGLSARELLWQRNQFTNEQLPISDRDIITSKNQNRYENHSYSEKSKLGKYVIRNPPTLNIGDLVYLYSDRNKSQARHRYLIVGVDGEWCFVKKFTGNQLRANSYKVKLCECYRVPQHVRDMPTTQHHASDDEEDMCPISHTDTNIPSSDIMSSASNIPEIPILIGEIDYSLPEQSPNLDNTSPETPTDILASSRPQRVRKPPSYLQDYMCD